MRMKLKVPPIILDWTEWHAWSTLKKSARVTGVTIPKRPGVYEVRRPGERRPIYVGRSVNLWQRIRGLLRGNHKPGARIIRREKRIRPKLRIRWAETDRPCCAEEELLRRFKPEHNRQG